MQYVKQLIEQITPHFPGTLDLALFHIADCVEPIKPNLPLALEALYKKELDEEDDEVFISLSESSNPVDQAVYLYFLYWKSMSLFGPIHYAHEVKKQGYNPVIDVVIKDLLDQTITNKGYVKPKLSVLMQLVPVSVGSIEEVEQSEPQFWDSLAQELAKP